MNHIEFVEKHVREELIRQGFTAAVAQGGAFQAVDMYKRMSQASRKGGFLTMYCDTRSYGQRSKHCHQTSSRRNVLSVISRSLGCSEKVKTVVRQHSQSSSAKTVRYCGVSMSNTAEVIKFPINVENTGGRMADLSNGYTRIANEIQKLKPRLRMSGREWQCLEAVIWLTYGWNKKQDRVTNTVISELTGLSDSHVSDAIRSLSERGIIFSRKQGVMKTVGINTELSAWILDKPKTGKVFPKKEYPSRNREKPSRKR